MRRLTPHAAWFARNFYSALFALDPALRPVFRTDMAEQGVRLMRMLAAAADGLDSLAALAPVLRALGQRHGAYGVRRYDFETVGLALVCALTHAHDDAPDDETLAAWRAAWQWMAREIQAGLHAAAPRHGVASSTP